MSDRSDPGDATAAEVVDDAAARIAELYAGRFESPPTSGPAPASDRAVWIISCGHGAESCVRAATSCVQVHPSQHEEASRVSPPPAREPTAAVGRHRHDPGDSDSERRLCGGGDR
jgi:hypothetical protein